MSDCGCSGGRIGMRPQLTKEAAAGARPTALEVRGPSRRVAPRNWDHLFSGTRPACCSTSVRMPPASRDGFRTGYPATACPDVTAPHPVDLRVRQSRFGLRGGAKRATREPASFRPECSTARPANRGAPVNRAKGGSSTRDRIERGVCCSRSGATTEPFAGTDWRSVIRAPTAVTPMAGINSRASTVVRWRTD